eukprot:scaffold275588_cov23-Tisochrysis_lutea.AAC.1
MAKLPEEVRARGVITSSAGNHAQGVALAASRMVRDPGRCPAHDFKRGQILVRWLCGKRTSNAQCPVQGRISVWGCPTLFIIGFMGCKATICMPVNTPGIKVESVRKLGGTVELVGESYQETQVWVCGYACPMLVLEALGSVGKAESRTRRTAQTKKLLQQGSGICRRNRPGSANRLKLSMGSYTPHWKVPSSADKGIQRSFASEACSRSP